MPRKCCVPECSSNYRGSDYVTVFRFPKDEKQRTKWIRAIKRKDFTPTKDAVVCIKHFSAQFIVTEDCVKRPDGSNLYVKRTSPKLAEEAYPSIFPTSPSYRSSEPPKKCRAPEDRRTELDKRDPQMFIDRAQNDAIDPFHTVDADKMVNNCAATNCKNVRQECPEMTFVRFPKDQARCNVWVKYSRRQDFMGKTANFLHKSAVLCEKHFKDSQWMNKNKKCLGLIHKAVPTLFDIPNHPLQKTLKRNRLARHLGDDQTEFGDWQEYFTEHNHCHSGSVDLANSTAETVVIARCCVLNCPSETKRGVRLYRFPADKVRLHKWIAYCGRESGWTPDVYSRLCELHFDEEQFVGGDEKDGCRPLKQDALPTRHYLAIPLTAGQKLRLLLGKVTSEENLVCTGKNNSGADQTASEIMRSCPASDVGSRTAASTAHVDITQESLTAPMSRKEAEGNHPDVKSESVMELSSKSELAVDLCKSLIAEMLLSSAEVFPERVQLINQLRDAWAAGQVVSLSIVDANCCCQATDGKAKALSINESCNEQTAGSGFGQMSICDRANAPHAKQSQEEEEEILSLDIECDVIKEDDDHDTRVMQTEDDCDQDMEKYEQASIHFGDYILKLLQSHDCTCPLKSKELTELVGMVQKKFNTLELQLKRQTTEAVTALQSHLLKDRYQEHSRNSTSKVLESFFNGFDGYQLESVKNDKYSAKILVTNESVSKVPGVSDDNVSEDSHRNTEESGQEHTASGCKPSLNNQSLESQKSFLYKCPFCHRIFPFFTKLTEHLPVHTKPFLCLCCGRRFVHEEMLTEHKITCTAGAKPARKKELADEASKSSEPVLCSTCGKQFLRRSSLYYHMRRHAGKPLHMCSFCGKMFYQNAVLVQHLRTHTGEKPYLCCKCPMKFVTNRMLQRHLRVHTGEMRPYTCDICHRSFSQSNSLKTHRLRHSVEKLFSCLHCERAFSKQSSLIRHMKSLTKDQRSLTCKTCGKVFRSKTRLCSHEVVHTGGRPPKTREVSVPHKV